MKKLLLLCSAALALSASSAFAVGLDLTWNNCVNETNAQDINFTNCNVSTRSVRFFGVLKVPSALPNFIAVSGVLDMQQEAVAALDRFWRFDDTSAGGCNAAGIGFSNAVEPSSTPCDSETSPWGFNGAEAGSSNLGFIAGFNGVPNRGRQFFSVNRDASSPFPLDVGINYYMMDVTINSSQRAACPGCTGAIAIVWNSAEMIENDNTRTFVTGPDKLGNCVTINHAGPATCAATPTRKSTWGQLKSLYR
jgi:hypothetical protein